MERFVALYDMHWGYETRGGHKLALHDPKAVKIAMDFIADFKPHHVILGGDILDCGAVSHHRLPHAGQLESLRLLSDAKELRETVIRPLEKLVKGRLVYIIGNHEDWLEDLTDNVPALKGIVEVESLLGLGRRWEVVEQGGAAKLGKLVFIHGDTIRGGEHVAKTAVLNYERNVRFGHFHTYQTFTKNTPVDRAGHTAVSVPCLCRKNPGYGEGKPNKWMQGFEYGAVNGPHGTFEDNVAVIVDGRAIIGGKVYKG